MKYEVTSKRMDWPSGTVLSAADLAGCNIEHLVATGHLALVAAPTTKKKPEPVQPDPVANYEAADEPQEQE
jgi:ribosomal protein L12E/L44/L45/RPP1/RPP2